MDPSRYFYPVPSNNSAPMSTTPVNSQDATSEHTAPPPGANTDDAPRERVETWDEFINYSDTLPSTDAPATETVPAVATVEPSAHVNPYAPEPYYAPPPMPPPGYMGPRRVREPASHRWPLGEADHASLPLYMGRRTGHSTPNHLLPGSSAYAEISLQPVAESSRYPATSTPAHYPSLVAAPLPPHSAHLGHRANGYPCPRLYQAATASGSSTSAAQAPAAPSASALNANLRSQVLGNWPAAPIPRQPLPRPDAVSATDSLWGNPNLPTFDSVPYRSRAPPPAVPHAEMASAAIHFEPPQTQARAGPPRAGPSSSAREPRQAATTRRRRKSPGTTKGKNGVTRHYERVVREQAEVGRQGAHGSSSAGGSSLGRRNAVGVVPSGDGELNMALEFARDSVPGPTFQQSPGAGPSMPPTHFNTITPPSSGDSYNPTSNNFEYAPDRLTDEWKER